MTGGGKVYNFYEVVIKYLTTHPMLKYVATYCSVSHCEILAPI